MQKYKYFKCDKAEMSQFDFFSSELYTARPCKGNYAIQFNVLVLYVEVSL